MTMAAPPQGALMTANDNPHDLNRFALNLNSNNPFRNRATSPSQLSPALASPASGTDQAAARMSKNPFLDASEQAGDTSAQKPLVSVPSDIFNDLSLLDKPAAPQKPPGPPARGPNGLGPPPRGPPRPPGSPRRPDAERLRRPRGMSETSVTEQERRERKDRERERSDKPPRTESEERRRRERRKEREERHRREKERGSKSRRPQGLDIIDKLDVTGVYGQGLFHHDGPFDACNPHRNSRRDRRAPMQAFPANSANMQLGGSGPINTRLDLDRFHGRGEEAFDAFNSARKTDTIIVDPTSRVEAIHGEETYGLGTSTFLEGAPASRKEIQRKNSDERREELASGGISRKKSLAQKFRGMSSGRMRPMDMPPSGSRANGDVFDNSPPPMHSVSAGGMIQASSSGQVEYNPFDKDYENAYEKKGAQIKIAEQERNAAGRARAPSSPNGTARGLVRTLTTDSDAARPGSGDGEGAKTGFLNRMKSLKGGKRARPERRES